MILGLKWFQGQNLINLSYVAELPTIGSTDAKFKIKGGYDSVMFRNFENTPYLLVCKNTTCLYKSKL